MKSTKDFQGSFEHAKKENIIILWANKMANNSIMLNYYYYYY